MKKRWGFTLIELLVVMAIVGILVGLSLTAYQGVKKSARDSKRKADLEAVRSALEMCRADTGSYPAGVKYSGEAITCDSTTYITIPQDPTVYRYYYLRTSPSSYRLCAHLETGGDDDCGPNCNGSCNYEVTNP